MDRPARQLLRFAPACLLTLPFLACTHSRTAPVTGSFEVLEPVATPTARAEAKSERGPNDTLDVVLPAEVHGTLQPTLPAETFAALDGQRSFVATVTYDERGQVADVSPSLRGLVLDPQQASEAFAAITAAVRQWRITPARLIHYQIGPKGERLYLWSEPLGGKVDVKFRFEIAARTVR